MFILFLFLVVCVWVGVVHTLVPSEDRGRRYVYCSWSYSSGAAKCGVWVLGLNPNCLDLFLILEIPSFREQRTSCVVSIVKLPAPEGWHRMWASYVLVG